MQRSTTYESKNDLICKATRISRDLNKKLLKRLAQDEIGFQQWNEGKIREYVGSKATKEVSTK